MDTKKLVTTVITPSLNVNLQTFTAPSLQVIPNQVFTGIKGAINGFNIPLSEARTRLAQYMSVIQGFGHTDISAMGNLTIGTSLKQAVTVIQKPGVLFPANRPVFQTRQQMISGIAMRSTKAGIFEAVKGGAMITDSQPLPVPNGSLLKTASTIPINVAYWFGTNIILEDDTTVILSTDVKSLVIIAYTLTVGKNVTITWERPPSISAAVPQKPGTPGDWAQATSVGSERGIDGTPGMAGGQGPHGQPAPEIELWFLTSTGFFPAIDLKGQDGFIGVKGADGGDGGRGQKGCNTEKNKGFCSQEQGPGGDGGNGGRAGDGGMGGNGGTGGKFSVFAPQQMINNWLQGGLTISVDGGNGGSGGDAGRPGEGGPGGEKGDKIHSVCKNNSRTPGVKGNTGASGVRGQNGNHGLMLTSPIRYSAIDPSDFIIELTKPAVVSVFPQTAYAGDTVSVNGLRFAQGDKICIEGFDGEINVDCVTTFVSQTLLTFKVPNVSGGYASLEVVQVDGTRSSSRGTLLIRPRINEVIPSGRVRPGEFYFLKGTGLGRNGNIWINGENIGAFQSIDNNTIKFKARRPSNAEINPAGENVKLKVVNAEGAGPGNPGHSAEIDIVLDTFQMLVCGDSVMWNGGVPEHLKHYSLAANYINAQMENASVYKTIKAHHGAKIGRGDNTVKGDMPGEMSSRWPTILQQIDSLSTLPGATEVDLLILDGGANDLPITDVMMTSKPSQLEAEKQTLRIRTHEYCYTDMVFMLQKALNQFPKAKIIVIGYFHIISEESDQSFVQKLILAMIDDPTKPLWQDTIAGTHNKAIELSNVWVYESNKNLSDAVNAVNNSLMGEPRVFFVNPETTPRNAAHAPESILWEPDGLGGPSDPMWKAGREQQRDANEARLKSEPSTLMDGYFITKRNSSYHPNVAGSHRYFEKMKPVLDLAAKSRRVAIRSKSTGRYLSADGGGGGDLLANRVDLLPWETFEMIDLGNNKAALKSVNGKFVCADGGAGLIIKANRDRIAQWETFTIVPAGTGFAFKNYLGNYLSVSSTANNLVIGSTSSTLGVTETFYIV